MNRIRICNRKHKKTVHRCKSEHKGENARHSRGPTSFDMHDPGLIFNALKLQKGDTFVDLGCGSGDYSIYAAKLVGDTGTVHALDIQRNLIKGLTERVKSYGLNNIEASAADITDSLPIKDNSCNVCLLSTVLHSINKNKFGKVFSEIRRILKLGGRVAFIECKADTPFGPPKNRRLSPEELEDLIVGYGFKKVDLIDLGYNYMIQFSV